MIAKILKQSHCSLEFMLVFLPSWAWKAYIVSSLQLSESFDSSDLQEGKKQWEKHG